MKEIIHLLVPINPDNRILNITIKVACASFDLTI